MDYFWSVAKVALRFACAKQSKNLKRYLIFRVYTLKIIFLGIKLFQDTRLKLSASVWKRISKNPTKFQLIQTIVISIFSISCLIEMKFSEFSRNFFSRRCWKFHLFFLKKYFLGRSQYQNKKALFTDPIFSDSFGLDNYQYLNVPLSVKIPNWKVKMGRCPKAKRKPQITTQARSKKDINLFMSYLGLTMLDNKEATTYRKYFDSNSV